MIEVKKNKRMNRKKNEEMKRSRKKAGEETL